MTFRRVLVAFVAVAAMGGVLMTTGVANAADSSAASNHNVTVSFTAGGFNQNIPGENSQAKVGAAQHHAATKTTTIEILVTKQTRSINFWLVSCSADDHRVSTIGKTVKSSAGYDIVDLKLNGTTTCFGFAEQQPQTATKPYASYSAPSSANYYGSN